MAYLAQSETILPLTILGRMPVAVPRRRFSTILDRTARSSSTVNGLALPGFFP